MWKWCIEASISVVLPENHASSSSLRTVTYAVLSIGITVNALAVKCLRMWNDYTGTHTKQAPHEYRHLFWLVHQHPGTHIKKYPLPYSSLVLFLGLTVTVATNGTRLTYNWATLSAAHAMLTSVYTETFHPVVSFPDQIACSVALLKVVPYQFQPGPNHKVTWEAHHTYRSSHTASLQMSGCYDTNPIAFLIWKS